MGLRYLAAHVDEWGVESLAVPPLGCGEGGLEWRVVGPVLYEHLAGLEIPVTIYAPFNAPQAELQIEYLEGQHTRWPRRRTVDRARIEGARCGGRAR